MIIDNIEYKPGLSSYGAPGKKGDSGNNGNKLIFLNISDSSTLSLDSSDFLLNNEGIIFNKEKTNKGSILNKELNLDDYYIDRYESNGTITFNIDKSECIKSDGVYFELRHKYTNEIKTILGYNE